MNFSANLSQKHSYKQIYLWKVFVKTFLQAEWICAKCSSHEECKFICKSFAKPFVTKQNEFVHNIRKTVLMSRANFPENCLQNYSYKQSKFLCKLFAKKHSYKQSKFVCKLFVKKNFLQAEQNRANCLPNHSYEQNKFLCTLFAKNILISKANFSANCSQKKKNLTSRTKLCKLFAKPFLWAERIFHCVFALQLFHVEYYWQILGEFVTF